MKKINQYLFILSITALSTLTNMAHAITSGNAEATLSVNNDWGSGYCAEVVVANNGSSSITDWEVGIDSNQSQINNLWNGNISGGNVSPMSYNANISSNGQASFGFCANATGLDYRPILVSLNITGGSGSTTGGSTDGGGSDGTATTGGNTGGTTTGGNDNGGSDNGGTDGGSDDGGSTGGETTGGDNGGNNDGGSNDGGSTGGETTGGNTDGGSPEGCDGYATRFWDCCKPHCGWSGNVPSSVNPIKSCSVNNTQLGSIDAPSSCNGGDAHTCYGLNPYKVNDTLSYGYAATSSGDVCGRCYQLQFTGSSHNAPGDPGSSALSGKTMIVQAINIGFDVSGGQFDILVPGGGVGAFNACSAQWGVSNSELGAQYGGFLAACKQEIGYNASLSEYKGCLTNRCNSVFGSRGLSELQQGCLWYADWFEAADNPNLKYKEVSCPAELINGSGMDRGLLGDISNACGN